MVRSLGIRWGLYSLLAPFDQFPLKVISRAFPRMNQRSAYLAIKCLEGVTGRKILKRALILRAALRTGELRFSGVPGRHYPPNNNCIGSKLIVQILNFDWVETGSL